MPKKTGLLVKLLVASVLLSYFVVSPVIAEIQEPAYRYRIYNHKHHWGGEATNKPKPKVVIGIGELLSGLGAATQANIQANISYAVKQWANFASAPTAGATGNPANEGAPHVLAPGWALTRVGSTPPGGYGKNRRSLHPSEAAEMKKKYPTGIELQITTTPGAGDIQVVWHDSSKAAAAGITQTKANKTLPDGRYSWRGRGKSNPSRTAAGLQTSFTANGTLILNKNLLSGNHFVFATDSNNDGWITNADAPTGLASSKYDFYTLFKHELGHTLTFLHSGEAESEEGTFNPLGNICDKAMSNYTDQGPSLDPASEEDKDEEAADTMYFASNRPGGYGGYDIWMIRKDATDWGNPINLGPAINSSVNEIDPYLATDSTVLLFSSDRPGGKGGYDIYESIYDLSSFSWSSPGNTASVNSSADDTDPTLSYDMRTLYFSSDRSGGQGGFDIWQSAWDGNVGYLTPTNLGSTINSSANEGGPDVFSYNGSTTLYFDSNRPGGSGGYDIYRAVASSPWTEPTNVFDVNSSYNEVDPVVYQTTGHLYIASDKPGGHGGYDIYEATPRGLPTITGYNMYWLVLTTVLLIVSGSLLLLRRRFNVAA